jgi:predicted DNA-binding transcriptional regulator YafY
MEHQILERQLRLLSLLTQNNSLTIENICDRLHLNRRSVYRYLETFKEMGFIVVKERNCYRIDHRSPFFTEITDRIHFNEEEAILINQLLNAVVDHSSQIRHLRAKLASLYDFEVLARHGIDRHIAKNLSTLFQAVREERVVVLHDYVSPHSGQKSDRIVEPYLFLSENSEVRCYEISSGMNKTFKISRAETVEILDIRWSHKASHAPFYTDLFHFSGEERYPVSLLLGPLAASLLIEEYPAAAEQMELLSDGRQRIHLEVCSYKGIGRFVLGLLDDIEIVDSPDFTRYLKERMLLLTQKLED